MTISHQQRQFSIIIPVRNGGAFIGETLDSVSAQTNNDFEVIVIDDGSTDSTVSVVKSRMNDGLPILLITGDQNGVSAARNSGLHKASGKIVLFLDADDLLERNALAKFSETLNETDANAALGGIQRMGEDGTILPGRDNRELVTGPNHLSHLLRKNFIVNGGALAIRRAKVLDCGAYDEELTYGEDWEFWCRLAELGDFAIVPGAPVLLYRQMSSGANYRAKGSVFARNIDCLKKIAAQASMQARFGKRLPKLLRARQIDIFWSGVRSELQFGHKARAFAIAFGGFFLYPDSIARPRLAFRFFKSLYR